MRGERGFNHDPMLRSTRTVALEPVRVVVELRQEDFRALSKDPRRHPRVAARWLQHYLEEDPQATVEEAALAASSLIALTGAGYQDAAQTLKAMAERATRRRRERGVA